MDTTHWVYVFARNGDAGMTAPVKVGISRDVNSRLATIQTSCPYKIDLAYVFECPDRDIARYIEQSFHETQQHKRTHGEWFDFEPVQAIHLLCIAFRTAFIHNVTDPQTVEAALDLCGVRWAERRFNLAVPTGAVIQ
jgi:hypothetical protein